MKRWFLICFLFLINSVVFAQTISPYQFRHIDQSAGLLHNEVFSITQDNRGFIWVGTRNGLQRYDGLRFKNYQEIINQRRRSFDPVTQINRHDDKLWLRTPRTICDYDVIKNKLTEYPFTELPDTAGLAFEKYFDGENRPWLLGEFAIYRYDNAKKSFIINTSSFFGYGGTSILYDKRQHQFWVTATQGLMLFDQASKRVYTSADNPINHPLLKIAAKLRFVRMSIDSYNNFWLSAWSPYLYRYKDDTGEFTTFPLSLLQPKDEENDGSTVFINYFFEDAAANIWMGTENAGLLKFDNSKNRLESIVSNDGKESLQYNYKVFCIFQDREKNIWVGTDKGINIFNPSQNFFQTLRHERNNRLSLPKNEIDDIIQSSSGDVYVATWGGGVTIFNENLQFKKNVRFSGSYEVNLTWSLAEAGEKIFIGCQRGVLQVFDRVTEKCETLRPPEFENSTLRCMVKDAEGNIWFGLNNGNIAEREAAGNRFLSYSGTRERNATRLPSVYKMFIDNRGVLWAGTDDGLKKFDRNRRVYVAKYILPDAGNYSSGTSMVRGIEEFNDSMLVVGFSNSGLRLFNKRTGKFSALPGAESLGKAGIAALKMDAAKNLWISSDYGIYKITRRGNKIVSYDPGGSQINSSFVSCNFYPLKDGRWITATSSEAIAFNPNSLAQKSAISPRVSITGMRVFNHSLTIDSLFANNEPLKLNHKQNFLSFEFSALSYSNLQKLKYFYRLSGVNGSWVEAGPGAAATYTNLDPGNYLFEVKAEGEGAPEQASFSFEIAPPFWKSWWFAGSVVALFALTVFIIVRRRINLIRNKAAMKHKIAETEMMALRAQMNPHFIFNCLSAIDNLIQTDQKDKATTYLARFAKLIRTVLDSSKNNVIPFYKELEALNLYLQLEQFRFNNKFVYTLETDDEIITGDYKVPPLLIQPFIENALHHGLLNKPEKDKNLSIKIGVAADRINYSIIDNGVGRTRAMELKKYNRPEHISYGIQISAERIHLYNGNGKTNDIKITDLYTNGKPSGTQVDVSIKIHDS